MLEIKGIFVENLEITTKEKRTYIELYLTEDDEVEYQALKITGNKTDSETKTNVKQNGLKASQYYPSGSIKIQDNTLNTEIGLKNITV